ncbi:MAG: hypothetical protein ACLPQ6_11225 [Steroidobacteraceae bacterium]|jgi:hypothetical protein
MPIVITAVLFCLWMAIAWRQYERGDLLLAGVCALVGVLLSVYRLKLWQARQSAKSNDDKSPLK